MSNEQSISRIMKKHHGQIEGLLNKFFNEEVSTDNKHKLFSRFKWELEKHFFTEERAVFFFIDAEDENSNEMKQKLLKEHDLILENLRELETNLNNNESPKNFDLRELLSKHKKFEDENFYPTLDNDLDPEKKKQIMDRLSNPL